MSIDLENMGMEELKKLRKDIDKAIDTYEQRQKAEARKELEEHAKKLGFKLEELVTDKPKKSKKPVPAKYQHPENSAITWSGRGMKPKWVKEHVDKGGQLDDLLLK
ncbi:H-NS histone family protein [Salibaculum griseiflavum]|uniref:Transcriptional regulator n=1 Tax=Salibaculum griseiflavum TaxID=1914409 RepID=A0A2V1NZA4_9RHOB|nr:H-NS histone family protein [Salibaculum griseiflavum]PWG15653.1 transcriptional regulator [Salibaculum griseiflavum]